MNDNFNVMQRIYAVIPAAPLDRNPKRCPSVVPTAKNSETISFLSVDSGIVAPLWPPIKGKSLRESWVPPRARNLETIVQVLSDRIALAIFRGLVSGSYSGKFTAAGDYGWKVRITGWLQEAFSKSSLQVHVFYFISGIRWYFTKPYVRKCYISKSDCILKPSFRLDYMLSSVIWCKRMYSP